MGVVSFCSSLIGFVQGVGCLALFCSALIVLIECLLLAIGQVKKSSKNQKGKVIGDCDYGLHVE